MFCPTLPGGIINLGTAENKLVGDLLAAKMKELFASQDFDEESESFYYFDFRGIAAVRKSVANFLERYFANGIELEDNGNGEKLVGEKKEKTTSVTFCETFYELVMIIPRTPYALHPLSGHPQSTCLVDRGWPPTD
jgi:hypothetical protein